LDLDGIKERVKEYASKFGIKTDMDVDDGALFLSKLEDHFA